MVVGCVINYDMWIWFWTGYKWKQDIILIIDQNRNEDYIVFGSSRVHMFVLPNRSWKEEEENETFKEKSKQT